jgi:hypothetical protein
MEFGAGREFGAGTLVTVTDAAAESLGERGECSEENGCRNHAETRPHEIPSC